MVILASLLVFAIATIFRLIDNSAALLIANGISVNPFYLSETIIRKEIQKLESNSTVLDYKLYRNIIFQKLHKIFVILAIITLIIGIVYEINNNELIAFL